MSFKTFSKKAKNSEVMILIKLNLPLISGSFEASTMEAAGILERDLLSSEKFITLSKTSIALPRYCAFSTQTEKEIVFERKKLTFRILLN